MSKKNTKHRTTSSTFIAFVLAALLFGIIALVLAIVSVPHSTQFRADHFRSGNFTSFNKTTGNVSWTKLQAYGKFISSPVIQDNVQYVSELYSNALRAIDLKTGRPLWSFIADDDIPFSPAVFGNTVFVTSSDGRLYALDKTTGVKQWEYRVENFFSMATSPFVFNKTVYFGSRDTYLYAVNASSGKLRWKFKTAGGIDSSPVVVNSGILFGSFDGNFYAVNSHTGKEKWKYSTGGKIIGSPAESGGIVYFGSTDGFLYAVRGNNGKLLWKTQTNGPIETTPTITDKGVIIANKNNLIHYLNRNNGLALWTKEFKTEAYTSAAVTGNFAYVGSSDGALYALKIKNGSEVWKFQTEASIASAPSVVGNSVIFTNRNGALYAIDKRSGLPHNKTINITQNTNSIDLYGIYELTIQHDSGSYQYPWLDASMSATFKHEDKEVYISGYYYDKNTWKIRFVPNQAGEWNWKTELAISNNIIASKKGSFTVTPAENEGFIKRNTSDGRILQTDKGDIYYPLGIQTCTRDDNDDGYMLNSLYLDTKNVDLDTYLQTYGKDGVGFNIYRFGIENCAFRLWRFHEDPRQYYPFLTREGIWADTLMNKLKINGFHIWFTLFWDTPVARETNKVTREKYIHTLDPYLDYIIARYGSYVDVWGLLNEANASKEWIEYVANYIRSKDPYQHLITISWERPELPQIDIHAPHWYDSNSLTTVDTKLAQYINYNDWGKPLIFGEFGNKGTNWDSESLTRMRVQLWVSYFMNAGLVFWDTSATKTHQNKDNANIFLGPDEREAIKSFRTYVDHINTNLFPTQTFAQTPFVRGYSAKTSNGSYGYLYHFANQQTKTTAILALPAFSRSDRTITWIDPQTGRAVDSVEITNATHVTSPPFFIDIAYRIEPIFK